MRLEIRPRSLTEASAIRGVLVALGLGAVALAVRSPAPWTGAAFIVVWGVFALAGLATLRLVFPLREPSTLLLVVMATAHGMGSAVVLWSVSALAFKRLGVGTAALVCLSMIGLRQTPAMWRGRRPLSSGEAIDAMWVAIAALALGLYVNGGNEIQEGDVLLYTFRWDWPSHLHWAQLVKEQGLPLVGGSGVSSVHFAALTHTGALCLLAGIQEATRIGPYGAARILGVGCFPLLALAALLGVGHRALGRRVVLAGLSPLVWGGMGFPIDVLTGNHPGILDPYLNGMVPMAVPSGTLYHNLTQLSSVALAAAALAAVDRCMSRRELGGFLLGGGLLGVSWLLKPSTSLVVMPALVLICLLARLPLRALVRLGAPFAACLAIYFLPALLVDLPPGPVFEARAPAIGATLLEMTVWAGLTGAVVARALFGLVRQPRRGRVGDAVALAMVGGVVVAACAFEPGRPAFGNNVWTLAAALVLLAPETTASAVEWARQRGFSGASLVAWALLTGHHLSGSVYLVRYPLLGRFAMPGSNREAVLAIREATRPDRRVLVDLALMPAAAFPYLGRPSPLPLVSLIQPAEIADRAEWLRLNRGEAPDPAALDRLLMRCDGVVIGPNTPQLGQPLRLRGWRAAQIELPAEYRLFKPPAGPGEPGR